MNARAKEMARAASMFVGILVVAAWPHPSVTKAVSAVYRPLGNLVLTHEEFGKGGHGHFEPLPSATPQPEGNVEADTLLSLSVDGYVGTFPLGISVRRDVYLPWIILAALLLAAPIPLKWRLGGPVLAVPLVWAASLGAYSLMTAWIFATQLQGVYSLSPGSMRLMAFAQGALLAPPGNRFIFPLAVGVVAVLWLRRRRTPSVRQ